MARPTGIKGGTRSRSRLGVQASDAPAAQFARPAGARRVAAHRLPGLLLLVLGLVTLRYLVMAPRFVVGAVEVMGTEMLSPDVVREGSGLLGSRIFGINERVVERELTRRYACVASVSVDCRLPSACQVRITEVSDVVAWEQGDTVWWVGLDGRVLGPATVATEAPVLRNRGPYLEPQDGYLIGVPWRYAMEVAQELAEGEALEFAPGYGLVWSMGEEQLPVYLGDEGDAQAKLALAAEALAEAKSRGVTIAFIDLRSDARPVVGGL